MRDKEREAVQRLRPLCPDHRDKMRGFTCLGCKIESQQRRLDKLRESIQYWSHCTWEGMLAGAPEEKERLRRFLASLNISPYKESYNETRDSSDD